MRTDYPVTGFYDDRPELLRQLTEALENESSRNIMFVYHALVGHGYESIEDIKHCNVAEAYDTWDGIGEYRCGLLKSLGAYGEIPKREKKPPEERKKLVCPICGSAMAVGGRVNVALGFEYVRVSGMVDKKSRSALVCRVCGEELAGKCGVEVPL